MVDPQPEIGPYLEAAAETSMRITHIIETHVHADHLSGARHLAGVTRAPVFFHETAEVRFPHALLEDEEEHEVGNVRLTVLHTPGHTPEGISILVADRTRGPEPWFVLTGDTLFPGGVGRPDLSGDGIEVRLAKQLYESLFSRLLTLPDHLEIYPAHFAGSPSANGLSGKAGSTIGFERRFNPALQVTSKPEFMRLTLQDLPAQPGAFAENRRRNLGWE